MADRTSAPLEHAAEVLIILVSDCLVSLGLPVEELHDEIVRVIRAVLEVFGERVTMLNPGLLAASLCATVVKRRYGHLADSAVRLVAEAVGVSEKGLRRRVRKIEMVTRALEESRSELRRTSS
ncbi:MAG: hypothetical protein QXW40_07985 [Thermofilum sp.]